jgi:hypothetical protein
LHKSNVSVLYRNTISRSVPLCLKRGTASQQIWLEVQTHFTLSLPSKEGGARQLACRVTKGSSSQSDDFTEGETSLNRAEGTTVNKHIILYVFTITQTNLPSHFQCDLNIPSATEVCYAHRTFRQSKRFAFRLTPSFEGRLVLTTTRLFYHNLLLGELTSLLNYGYRNTPTVREAYNNGVAPKHFAKAKYITSL